MNLESKFNPDQEFFECIHCEELTNMTRLTFIKFKHPDGSFGVTLQEPLTEQEAEKIAHKLNRALELIKCL